MKKLLLLTALAMLTAGTTGCRCFDWLWRGNYCQPEAAPVVVSGPCDPCVTTAAPCGTCGPALPGPAYTAPGGP